MAKKKGTGSVTDVDLTKKLAEIEAKEAALNEREEGLNSREEAVHEKESALNEREEDLNTKESNISEREKLIQQREEALENKQSKSTKKKEQKPVSFDFRGETYRFVDNAPEKIRVEGTVYSQKDISKDEELLVILIGGGSGLIKKVKK